MHQRLRGYHVLWTAGTRRCVLEMADVLPPCYFVSVFDSAKLIFTQRCDTLTDAAELGEALQHLSAITLDAVMRPRVL